MAMVGTERHLLAALADDPHDDLARSVYADWLEENGDEPRGEFLRLQLALKRVPLGSYENALAQARLRQLRRGLPRDWLRLAEPLALFPALSGRARTTLEGEGVHMIGELHESREEDLLDLHGIDETSRVELKHALAKLGLSMRRW
jgi:uncharacterized protein (TIGR02996 family)